MKKRLAITIICVWAVTYITSAQDTLKPRHRNELGLDFTPFLKFYLSFGDGPQYSYQPVYFVTYRYHFKRDNIRAAIGGGYSENEITSPFQGDVTRYKQMEKSINFRIGYEHFDNLSKRWQVFYGIDFRPSLFYSKNDAPYWNGGYANGVESQTTVYGLAPILGLRFMVNKRLSILTESSWQISKYESWQKRYYIPVDSSFPALPDSPKTESKSIGTGFSFPLALVITMDI